MEGQSAAIAGLPVDSSQVFQLYDRYRPIPAWSRLLLRKIGEQDMPSGKLLAWIEPRGGDREFTAAFVSAPTAERRAPATYSCASLNEAREWVEVQAAALGVPVEWTDDRPRVARG
jgi:hypothetical protein